MTANRFRFALVVAALLLWGGTFIAKSSFEINGERYFCLFDDAMISMTYARNLVEGYGLNWARWGKPVEGFSCPLWTATMVAFQLPFVELRFRSLAVQVFCLLLLAINLWAVRRLTIEHFSEGRGRSWLPAVVLTAAFFPLNYWTLMGMETGLQALLMTSLVWIGLDLANDLANGRRRRFRRLFVLLAAAALLRPDMLIVVVTVTAWVAWQRRSEPLFRRRLLFGVVAMIAMGVVVEVARIAYFGAPLPNTYYLKLTGVPASVRILRGALVFKDWAWPTALLWAPVLVGSAWLGRRQPRYQLPTALVALCLVYSIYVGGDVWEDGPVGTNRWITPAMPLLFVLLNGLLNRFLARGFLAHGKGSWSPIATATAGTVLTVSTVLVANGLVSTPNAKHRRDQYLLSAKVYTTGAQRTNLQELLYIESHFESDAKLAAVWAGAPAYFSNYRMVDVLGYNDRTIARMDPAVELVVERAREFVPGHMKWNYEYLLEEMKPDAMLRVFGLTTEQKNQLFTPHGYYRTQKHPKVWLRADSVYLREKPDQTARNR